MPKQYLFFAAQYLPTAGGVERYTFNLARNVIAKGHRAMVVTSALPNLPEYEVDENGIEIFRLPSFLLMGGRFPVLKICSAFFALCKKIWQRKIDFCLVNTYFYPLSLYAVCAAKKRKIKTILINHGSAYLMTGNPLLSVCGMMYEQLAARFACAQCPEVYGVSGAACSWMEQFGVKTTNILSNAIEPEVVQQQATQANINWREHLNLPEDTKVIAFAGRMIPEKGVDALATAITEIRKTHPSTVMVLAGEGALLVPLREKQIEGFYLLGKQSYEHTLALVQQADLFCLPTRSEGFACTVLEAAALHCPIITTATGGSPQLLENENFGTLLPDMSAEGIVKACNWALADASWRTMAAENAYQGLVARYTWTQVTKALLEISGAIVEE